MKTASSGRRYRTSAKRQATRERNRAAIEKAAWKIFCTTGLDGVNIRDIVKRSGVSAGTFYNYYGTKEAIFEVLSQQLLERIRAVCRDARSRATSAEEMLVLSYRSYLKLLHSIDGAMEFIDRNRHHARSQMDSSAAMSGLAEDLEKDLRRFIPQDAMPRDERMLACSMIIAVGAEAVLSSSGMKRRNIDALAEFLARFMFRGLSGWTIKAVPAAKT